MKKASWLTLCHCHTYNFHGWQCFWWEMWQNEFLDSTKTCFTAKCQFAAEEWNFSKYLLENKFGTVSQLSNDKRWRDLIAPFLHLDICVLRGLPATQERDCCCACWSASGCGASSCSPGKLSVLLFCAPLRFDAGAGQLSWRFQALDPKLTFQVQAQWLVFFFKVDPTLLKTKKLFQQPVFETSVAFLCFLVYRWRELLFLVL